MYDSAMRCLILNGSLNLNGNQVADKVKETVPQLQSHQWELYCFRLHNGHLMERPQRNVVNNLSNDIYYRVCATVSTQLSHTASFDVCSFDAASDVPPTRLQSRGNRKRKICRKGKKNGGGQRCIEKTQPLCQRETHSVTQSLALQMLVIGSVNGPHAFSLNPSIVREVRSSLTVQQSVGVELGSSGIHCGYVWDSRLFSYHSQMSK